MFRSPEWSDLLRGRLVARLGHEHVPHARLVADKHGIRHIPLDLLAQTINSDAQDGRVVSILGSPYGIQQVAMQADFARIGNQLGEQSKLGRRQAHRFAIQRHLPVRHVHEQQARLERRLFFRRRRWRRRGRLVTAQHGFNPRLQRAPTERLDQVVVGA
jgi:hypothetical protein